ncbi:accessory colonization factor AcfD [Vibrio cholerae]|nr:accessory colonization factor AcfD [Vibrio cholerae]
MVKAANLGTNIHALYQHERYFRTKGNADFYRTLWWVNICTRGKFSTGQTNIFRNYRCTALY